MHGVVMLLTDTEQGMAGAEIRHTQLTHLSWTRFRAWGLTSNLFLQLIKNVKLAALPMILGVSVCVYLLTGLASWEVLIAHDIWDRVC